MTEVKRVLGTSMLSLFLVIWGLFMVCSGRVPDVNYDDDLFADGEFQDEGIANGGNSELMDQLAVLDDESTAMQDNQRNEILAALGISPEESGSRISQGEEEDFLSEELFLDLEVEIAELEKIAKNKEAVAESLRMEVQEADFQLSAMANIASSGSGTQLASTNPVVRSTPRFASRVSNSEYAAQYQNALNDVYAKRFNEAIAKFRQLLQMGDTDNLADNCQYWIGESYYALGQYESAIAEFEKVFAFDDNNKTDDAQFMIGLAYIRLGDPRVARSELVNLMSFYQDSEYLARAQSEFNDLAI